MYTPRHMMHTGLTRTADAFRVFTEFKENNQRRGWFADLSRPHETYFFTPIKSLFTNKLFWPGVKRVYAFKKGHSLEDTPAETLLEMGKSVEALSCNWGVRTAISRKKVAVLAASVAAIFWLSKGAPSPKASIWNVALLALPFYGEIDKCGIAVARKIHNASKKFCQIFEYTEEASAVLQRPVEKLTKYVKAASESKPSRERIVLAAKKVAAGATRTWKRGQTAMRYTRIAIGTIYGIVKTAVVYLAFAISVVAKAALKRMPALNRRVRQLRRKFRRGKRYVHRHLGARVSRAAAKVRNIVHKGTSKVKKAAHKVSSVAKKTRTEAQTFIEDKREVIRKKALTKVDDLGPKLLSPITDFGLKTTSAYLINWLEVHWLFYNRGGIILSEGLKASNYALWLYFLWPTIQQLRASYEIPFDPSHSGLDAVARAALKNPWSAYQFFKTIKAKLSPPKSPDVEETSCAKAV